MDKDTDKEISINLISNLYNILINIDDDKWKEENWYLIDEAIGCLGELLE